MILDKSQKYNYFGTIMKAKVRYYITDRNLTKEEFEIIFKAKNESDYDALVDMGLATHHIEDAEMIFTKNVKELTKWQKIKLLFKLLGK